jgi:hypothetical protein
MRSGPFSVGVVIVVRMALSGARRVILYVGVSLGVVSNGNVGYC